MMLYKACVRSDPGKLSFLRLFVKPGKQYLLCEWRKDRSNKPMDIKEGQSDTSSGIRADSIATVIINHSGTLRLGKSAVPYRDASESQFDKSHAGSRKEIHSALRSELREARRILDEGGALVLLIENRVYHALAFLRTVARRMLAFIRPSRTRLEPYPRIGLPQCRMSLSSAEKLARHAGFNDIDVFSIHPGLKNAQTLYSLRRKDRLFRSAMVRLRQRILSPAFILSAAVGEQSESSLLTAIKTNIEQCLSAPSNKVILNIDRIVNTQKEKSIVFGGVDGDEIIIRIPHSKAALNAENSNFKFLSGVKPHDQVAGLLPMPILKNSIARDGFFVEQKIHGRLLSEEISRTTRTKYLGEVDSFIRSLNPDLERSDPISLEGTLYEKLVCPYLDQIIGIFKDERVRENIKIFFRENLEGAKTRMGIVHGDLSVNNILVDGRKITGVIDWEDVTYSAPPVLDALNYLDSVERACNRKATLKETIPWLAGNNWPVVQEKVFVDSFFHYCGIDLRFRQGFVLLYWLYHVGPQLKFNGSDDTSELRGGLEGVLRQFLEL